LTVDFSYSMMARTSTAAAVMFSLLTSVHGLERPDNVGKLPALGWNSWNAFGCDVDETKILTAADQIVSLGLKDLGYEYVNIDDCWSVKDSRNATTGQIVPDPTKFPDGISGLADKIHAMGLKIGIYSSAGETTCAGYPASLGNEDLDAQTFAGWGIDYLKYDNCGVPSNWTDQYNYCVPDSGNNTANPNGTCPGLSNPAPSGYDWSTSNTAKRYTQMRDALVSAQDTRTILFSLCEWGSAGIEEWGASMGNSWRTTGDIQSNWPRISTILNMNSFELSTVDFWGHNDPDMLEVGNGDLTLAENRAHFALWAAMKSPLIIGTALNETDSDHIAILANKYLIAFHQDPEVGRPAYPYKWGYNPDWTYDADHPAEYWSGPTSTGQTLVIMLNTEDGNANRTATWSEVPELSSASQSCFNVTDAWTGSSLGCIENEYTVELESHDVAVLIVET